MDTYAYKISLIYYTYIFLGFSFKEIQQKRPPPGGLEPPTFRLTAERASRLRHGGLLAKSLTR